MEDTEPSIDDQDFSTEERRLHGECGITCHLSSHQSFRGKIKVFPEDFKVIEIDNDGNLVCPSEEIPEGWDPAKFRREKISALDRKGGDAVTEAAQSSEGLSSDKHQADTPSGKGADNVEKKAKGEEDALMTDNLGMVEGGDGISESSHSRQSSEQTSSDKHQKEKANVKVVEDSDTVNRTGSVVMDGENTQMSYSEHNQSTCSQVSMETASTPAGVEMEKCQQGSRKGDNVRRTGKEEDETLDMEGILGEDRLDQLKNFSTQVLEAEKEGQLNKDQSDVSNLQLSLGRFDSKVERSTLHKEIKSRHPHLKTTSADSELHVVPDENYWVFCSLQDRRVVDDFMRFVNNRDSSEVFRFPECGSKERRTELHRAVARHYGSFLETKTFAEEGEGSFIVVRFRERGRKRKSRDGDAPVTFYTGFTLYKRNLETLDVIQRLARCVSAHPSDFSYAGVKDKRAVTWQAMAARGVTPDSLRSAAAHPSLRDVGMEKFLLRQQPLRLGNLAGNVFKVLLRDVRLCQGEARDRDQLEAVVGAAMDSVKERGFINYFGLQRFGSADSKSFAPHVGRALLKGDMSAAVGCLLHPDPGDDPVNAAKAYYVQTGDIPGTLARMPGHKTRECLLLKALRRHGTSREGCTKAFLNVPHAMRALFVHSYCSLVWNRMVSRRVRTYGWRAAEGDLVLETSAGNRRVRTLTQTDVEQGNYSMDDVVLPLPGNSIQYPSNQLGEEYARAMQEDGIERSSFRMRALKLNIPGDYRHVTARPKALEWELLSDGDLQDDLRSAATTGNSLGTESLSQTSAGGVVRRDTPQGESSTTNDTVSQETLSMDLQDDLRSAATTGKSLGTESPSQTSAGGVGRGDTRRGEGSTTNGSVSRETRGPSEGTPGNGSHGDSFHVRTRFALAPSCYATMFLREVMNT
ncbi:PUS7L [Branchiostoma lanceolatum]|uniref:PUS7L protein n=1 Tax=Branchiostoma lanceolatum TaxID=7740 RepID=A0A8J9ZVQ6_BRALA|nr:PUS7L [Branchiostoma lanceolatum]